MLMPVKEQIGYASGNLGKSLLWTSLEYLLLFYLTDLVGVPPATAGLMILLSLAWDGAINPLIGYWLDLRASKGRDYRPFLRCAPPAAALLFVAIFYQPFGLGDPSVSYLFVILLAFRTAYALLDVPHNGLLAFLPVDASTRTNIAGLRYFFSSLGGLLIALSAAPIVLQVADADRSADLSIFAALAGLLLCLTVWQSLRPAQQALIQRELGVTPISPLRFLTAILKNPPAMLYLGLASVFAATTPLFGKMLPFLIRYVHEDPGVIGQILIAMTLGQMFSMLVCTSLARSLGRLPVGLACLLGIPVLLLGVRMEAQMLAEYFWLVSAVFGFLLGGAIMILWATSGDIADQISIRATIRTDAGLIAFLTLVQKAGIGFGAMMAGALLEDGGFRSGSSQSPEAQDMIVTLGFVLPSIGAVICAALLFSLYRMLSVQAR